MYDTILWDNDGVLVDTEGIFFAETRAAFARLGLELTEEIWAATYLGKGTPSKEIAREMGADRERVPRNAPDVWNRGHASFISMFWTQAS